MGKPFRNPADEKRRINGAHKFVAAMCTDPAKRAAYEEHYVKDLPPKRDRIRRPVDRRPVHPSEHQEQARVIAWWGLQHALYDLPEFALFAVPNGGARDIVSGARLKAEGVRPGAPDLVLAAPRRGFHGMFIELKVGDNKPSDRQKAFLAYLNAAGYETGVYWTSDGAIEAIKAYLA